MRTASVVDDANDPATLSAPDQVIAAILGTREGASLGRPPADVDRSDDGPTPAMPPRYATALAARKVENVMLVSAFLAAAALAQTVGNAIGYEYTAMLFIETDTATLATGRLFRRFDHRCGPPPRCIALMLGGRSWSQ